MPDQQPQSLTEILARAMAAVDGAPEYLMPQAAAALKEMQKLMDAGVFARPLPLRIRSATTSRRGPTLSNKLTSRRAFTSLPTNSSA
jgi:hypothetical protein